MSKIAYNNFSGKFTSKNWTFYSTDYYVYVYSESWGFFTSSQSAFLADWHGDCYIDYWNGSGWTNYTSHYMQDTNANKSGSFRHNASLQDSGAWYYNDSSSGHNLWRIRWIHEKWGGSNGVYNTLYIGDMKTGTESYYNSYVQKKKIYSNGRVGLSDVSQGAILAGTSALSDQTVLDYFQSDRGTKIAAAYQHSIVGAIR